MRRWVGVVLWLIGSTFCFFRLPSAFFHAPMRRSGHSAAVAEPAAPGTPRSDLGILKRLWPYLWRYRWRVVAALGFLLLAKLANVGVPVLLKHLVDALDLKAGDPRAVLVVPIGLLLAYAGLRLSTTLFTELRELVFAKATFGASQADRARGVRPPARVEPALPPRAPDRRLTRDIERGTRALQSLIAVLAVHHRAHAGRGGAGARLPGLALRRRLRVDHARRAGAATSSSRSRVTEWRTQFRRQMNELDSKAHTRAIDALLNYETVKYFNNEAFEARRYDEGLEAYRQAQVKSQTTLSLLNTGQQLIIATSLVAMLWRATQGVVDGRLTLGDLVMINAFLIQLYIPLNFLGVLYREVKQSLTDLDRMFALLEREREVADQPGARALLVQRRRRALRAACRSPTTRRGRSCTT